MKSAKKAKENQIIIAKQNQPSTTDENSVNNSVGDDDELQNMLNFMKTADISTDLSMVIEFHKKSFPLRQHYRQTKDIAKLVSDFPRFFDVDGLVSKCFT